MVCLARVTCHLQLQIKGSELGPGVEATRTLRQIKIVTRKSKAGTKGVALPYTIANAFPTWSREGPCEPLL